MVTADSFADSMDFLKNHGYNVISLDSAINHIRFGSPIPENAIVLTFDDNYRGAYFEGFPIMQIRDFPCTFFVHTFYVGKTTNNEQKPTWEDLYVGETTGLLSVESHTWTHANLTAISLASVRFELETSKRDIEHYLHKECKYIAYPYGAYNYSVISIAQEVGYVAGLKASGTGLNDPSTPLFEISRIFIDLQDTLNQFKNKVGYTGQRLPMDPYIINNDGNGDGNFEIFGSGWITATTINNLYGAYGRNYLYHAGGFGNNTAKWTVTLAEPGFYEIYAWLMPSDNNATDAKYLIENNGGYSRVTVNQKTCRWGWNYIGAYYFPKDSLCSIYLTDDANGIVIADAIKLILQTTCIEDWIKYH